MDRKDLNDEISNENVCFTEQNLSKEDWCELCQEGSCQQLGPLNNSTMSSMGLLSLLMCTLTQCTLKLSMGWRSKKRLTGPV